MTDIPLSIELVPQTCWFSNVRSNVSAAQWDLIRKQVASKAYSICEICGGVGPKHPVESHEIWSYDDELLIQKLEGMIALCPACHGVKHFGFSRVRGNEEVALLHFMKINKLSRNKAEKLVDKSFKIWEQRSKKKWGLDISYLKTYGIDVSRIIFQERKKP